MEADDRTIVTFGMKIPAGIFIPTMVCPLGVLDVGCWRAFRTDGRFDYAVFIFYVSGEYAFQFLCDRRSVRLYCSGSLCYDWCCSCIGRSNPHDCLPRRHQ
jgi:hypothetical protein